MIKASKKEGHFEIAIISARFTGLGAPIRIKKRRDNDFFVFEKAKEIGGTWRDNDYPGFV